METACKVLKGHEGRKEGPKLVTASIRALKITQARGKRADLPPHLKTQGGLMGGSAAKVGTAFPMRDQKSNIDR